MVEQLYDPSKQLWEVVGGLERGGLVVRREAETTSYMMRYRLVHGSWVQELERRGERLHYQRLTGEGPDIGWVSVEAKSRGSIKVFLEPRDGPPPGWKPSLSSPKAAPSTARAQGPRPPSPPPPVASVPANWNAYNVLWENLPGGPLGAQAIASLAHKNGQPQQVRLPGSVSSGSPHHVGWPDGAAGGGTPTAGQQTPKRRGQGPIRSATTASPFAGAVRETDYEVDFEVVHEKVMVRRSPSTKDALLGVIKEGAVLRGVPYDVAGDPWLFLAVDTCDELHLKRRQGWVLINGRSVGLGELLREVRDADGQARSGLEPEGAMALLQKEARKRQLQVAGALPEPEKASADAADNDGEGAGEAAKPDVISVAFWGICDIKYDPRRPKRDRVKVLELGDGKISRFSHHGRRILEKYKSGYCMDEVPIKRSVMVENKKFTHDVFVREGFEHLRPKTMSYERKYDSGLALRILADLGLTSTDNPTGTGKAVVLKLCNRSRGAGVCVVTGEELDGALKQLLTPPLEEELEAWLQDRAPKALNHKFESQFEETYLHWWSNECPLFVAEECCQSEPVPMEQGGADRFDGTLRVAFALHRGAKTHKWEGARSIKPFDIDWLGGYWKLPRVPSVQEAAAGAEAQGEGLEDLHGRIVSSFNSREKRTAEVDEAHLQEVYDALTPALPRIFQTGSLGVQQIQDAYSNNTLFRSFALSRAAAQMRFKEMPKAIRLYQRSREMVQTEVVAESGARDMPRASALSYIERNIGVCQAMQGDWSSAATSFQTAVRLMPTNATALYLQGCYQQEQGMLEASVTSLMRCLALDPDFKLPYVALGTTRLMLEQFDEAAETARACLFRHPDAPVASFTLGQAIYHILREWEGIGDSELIEEATHALNIAKQREPKQWTDADESMLHYFLAEASERTALQRQPVHPWRNIGWRP